MIVWLFCLAWVPCVYRKFVVVFVECRGVWDLGFGNVEVGRGRVGEGMEEVGYTNVWARSASSDRTVTDIILGEGGGGFVRGIKK